MICHWANLLWALSAPDIVRDSLPWLPAHRRAELADHFSRADIRTRLEPRLNSELEAQQSSRLGVYFEDLWAFAFTYHPHYQLLHRNLPLRSEGRTLGELDFVLSYLPESKVEHWEIAVKFYLQVRDYWVGPGLRDRLDIKLARMREHQLPLTRRAEAREILRQRRIHIDRQWALMPGRLFRPLGQEQAPLPGDINPGSCRYWWATLTEFRSHFAGEEYRWLHLPKRAWLAESGYRVSHGQAPAELIGQLSKAGPSHPTCVAAVTGTGEKTRGFIVPDSWAQEAALTLPPRS